MQRVALARALVTNPEVMLLDEPLSSLDARLRDTMRSYTRKWHRDAGLTTLYVTHDQMEALSLADRVAVMCSGRLQQVGPPPRCTIPRSAGGRVPGPDLILPRRRRDGERPSQRRRVRQAAAHARGHRLGRCDRRLGDTGTPARRGAGDPRAETHLHMTGVDAGVLARRACAGRLITVHHPRSDREWRQDRLAEIRENYAGPVEFGETGMVVIPPLRR